MCADAGRRGSYQPLRVGDLPRNLRPREMLQSRGAKNASDDVLLAIILRIGVPGANVLETARRLLVSFGTLEELSKATPEEIVAKRIPGIGPTRALEIVAAIEFGRRCSYLELIKSKKGDARQISSTADVYDLLMPLVYGNRQELFFVIHLGPRNKLLGNPIEVAKGQRDEVALQPNLLFESALKLGAQCVIVAHNHPSGDPMPSEDDVELTRKVVSAGKLLNIPVLDHIILGVPTDTHSGFFSIAASGLVEF